MALGEASNANLNTRSKRKSPQKELQRLMKKNKSPREQYLERKGYASQYDDIVRQNLDQIQSVFYKNAPVWIWSPPWDLFNTLEEPSHLQSEDLDVLKNHLEFNWGVSYVGSHPAQDRLYIRVHLNFDANDRPVNFLCWHHSGTEITTALSSAELSKGLQSLHSP